MTEDETLFDRQIHLGRFYTFWLAHRADDTPARYFYARAGSLSAVGGARRSTSRGNGVVDWTAKPRGSTRTGGMVDERDCDGDSWRANQIWRSGSYGRNGSFA